MMVMFRMRVQYRTTTAVLLFLLTMGGILGFSTLNAAQPESASYDVIPKVGVYITAEDIQNARNLVKTKAWAKKEADQILSDAAMWANMPDTFYQNLMPPKGSVFAYGQAGCPIDKKPWGANFGGKGIVELIRPYTLRCSNGQLVYFNDPDSPYYDPGSGVVIDGVKYYLRGIYNAYVTNLLAGWGDDEGVVHKLAYAYALTGDPKYAHKALIILDALATLSPTTIGPRDFERSPTSVEGRLHWLTSIVFRARMHLINAYDLVYNYTELDGPSPTNPGLNLKENIETGLFLDYVFGEYDMRNGQLSDLHNHEADSVRGMLGVGLLLGIPEYITWGINAAAAFFDNTIDRDGLYYETSLSYSGFSQGVFLDMADLAYNYSPDKYEGEGFPAREEFPYAANFFDHPKLQKFLVGFRERIDAAGFVPTVGDGAPNWNRTFYNVKPLSGQERLAAEYFAQRASSAADRAKFTQMLLANTPDIDAVRSGRRLLFLAKDLQEAPLEADAVIAIPQTTLLGNTRLGFLRSGNNTRAALMRGGVTLPHGHDDILGLDLFGKGYDITTEIGYGIHGSPLHLGWGSRGIAHNLVVVNKGKVRNNSLFQIGPGADTIAFFTGSGFAGMEMDASRMFQMSDGVTQYQRGVYQIDVSPAEHYWVDVFRVTGGVTHDYSFHTRGSAITFNGVDVKEIADVWTLHGLDDPNASFDAPGRSWGERVSAGEGIRDMGVPSEGVASRYWTPAPGNGYGFIYNLKGGTPDETWEATWDFSDGLGTQFRLTMLGGSAVRHVYTGYAPDLGGQRKYAYLVARREADENLQSRFAAVMQIYMGAPVVTKVTELPLRQGSGGSVAMRIELDAGLVDAYDYVLSNPAAGVTLATADGMVQLATDALFALIRMREGRVEGAYMVGGTQLRYGDTAWQAEQGVYTGVLEQIDYHGRRLLTKTALPLGDTLAGSVVTIDNPGYMTNTAYEIKGVSRTADGLYAIELGDTALEAARNQVDRVAFSNRVLTQKAPLPTAFEYNQQTGALDGKLVMNEAGASAIIKRVPGMKTIELTASSTGFAPDDAIVVYDVQAGDEFVIHTWYGRELNGDVWRYVGTVQGK
jgi:hypothetical protein